MELLLGNKASCGFYGLRLSCQLLTKTHLTLNNNDVNRGRHIIAQSRLGVLSPTTRTCDQLLCYTQVVLSVF